MILLDEIDAQEKIAREQDSLRRSVSIRRTKSTSRLPTRESLPPYSPPIPSRRPLEVLTNTRIPESTPPTPALLFSPPSPSSSNQLSFPSSSSSSRRDVSPHAHALSESSFQPSSSSNFSTLSLASTMNLSPPSHAHSLMHSPKTLRSSPPPHARPANNVYVERESAAVLGTYVIDPALDVPDCLLPDELLEMEERDAEWDVERTKGKGKARRKKRHNLNLVTRSGEVSVDVWIRDGCTSRTVNARRGSEDRDADYWDPGWDSSTYRADSDWMRSCPGVEQAKERMMERAELAVKSETGCIMVKLHAPQTQRFKLHVSSVHGSVCIGIPRSFQGPIFSNTRDSQPFPMSLLSPIISRPLARTKSSDDMEGFGLTRAISNISATTTRSGSLNGIGSLKYMGPTPLSISSGLDGEVVDLSDRKSMSRQGLYFVGDRHRWDTLGQEAWDGDELHIVSRTGAIGIFYNCEPPLCLPKGPSIISKLITKATGYY